MGIRLKAIDGVLLLNDPAFLIAAAISSTLLIFLTMKWFTFWYRTRGIHDPVARIFLVVILIATYFGIGIFHFWFATAIYREYYDVEPDVTLGLYVPVFPVWFVGALSAGVFVVVRAVHRKRSWKNDKGASW